MDVVKVVVVLAIFANFALQVLLVYVCCKYVKIIACKCLDIYEEWTEEPRKENNKEDQVYELLYLGIGAFKLQNYFFTFLETRI